MALKVLAKPIGGLPCDCFEGAMLFKEVGRAGHDLELFLAVKFRKRFLVEPDHHIIVSTHDEQRRRLHASQCGTREIGPPAAGYNGIDAPPDLGRSHQRRTAAGARSEIADAEVASGRLSDKPPRHLNE